jgi:cellobiose phosphorylase
LQIAPVIPESWEGFEVVRCFRGVRYHIQVERIGPGNRVRLSLDGRPVEGTLLPPPPPGVQEVRVAAKLGGL